MMKLSTKRFSIKPLGLFALLSMFIGGFSAKAQTLISEDFSTNPPPGWTATDISGSDVNWVFDNPGSRTITGGTPGFDANFAILDSDHFGSSSASEDATLESPAFDASGGGTIQLEFDNQYRAVGTGDGVPTIEVWDGTQWNAVVTYPTTSDGYPNPASHKAIDITDATGGSAAAKVRFHWVNGSWDWWWAIDNVTVTKLNCTAATATFAGNLDCANNQFYVDANITDMGSASSLQVTDDQGSAAQNTSSTGIVEMGPYAYGTQVTLTVTNADDDVCHISSDPIGYAGCPPTNDECANAIAFPAIATDGTCASVTANTEFATQSMAGCAGTADDDVWYSFVCPTGVDSLLFTNTSVSGSGDRVIQFFSGDCGSLTSLKCSDPESGGIGSLTPGETYYLRVYTYGSGNSTEVNICLQTVPPPPANDNMDGAISLTVNPDYNCGTTTSGTTLSATASTPSPSCGSTYADDDVWYSFVATGTGHRVTLTNLSGTSTSMAMAVYEADGITEVTGGACATYTTTKNLTGLTVGNTYYVRVWNMSSTGAYTNFDICVGTPPPPPVNDDCSSATSIASLPYTNSEDATSATQTDFVNACPSGMNDGVWYQVEGTGCQLTVEVEPTGWDPAVGIFSGDCGNLECVTRVDNAASGGTETATFSTVAGTTYFINIGHYSSSTNSPEGAFDIGVTEDCCPTPADIAIDNITSTGATVTWSGGANSIVEYGPAGFTPGTGATAGTNGTVASVAGTSYEIENLDPETDYDVYVRSDCGSGTYSDNSDVESFTTLALPPANDEAAGAIELTLGAACSSTPYNNTSATQSVNEPFPSCRGTAGYAGMWYKFVAPSSGAVKISCDEGGTMGDSRMALFSAADVADYTTFTEVACDDDNGFVSGSRSLLYATGLTPNATYYIDVDLYSSSTTRGTYCVTVDELSSSMLATSASCASGQTLYAQENYSGQSSMVDDDGNLIAIVKRNTAGTGTTLYNYSNSLNINTGSVREDGNGVPYLDRNFRITYSQSSAPSDFDVQLFFLNSELSTLGADLPDLNVSRVEGSTCIGDFEGVATLLTQNSNGTANGISWIDVTTPGFSNFFIHSGNAPLPIKLGDITAKNNGTANDIAWNTLDEREGDYFELERSIDGKDFAVIATIKAKGTPAHYTYTDANAVKGKNYYRLHLLNNDGSSGYSKIVAAEVKTDVHNGINVFPNPTSGNISVHINGNISGHARIIITDISGKVVNTISNVDINDVTIPMSELSAGLYFVKYTDDSFTQTVKVTKK